MVTFVAMAIFDKLPEVLAEMRRERKLSQLALAEKAEISNRMIGRYERGEQLPELLSLEKLMRGLGATLGELAFRLDRANERETYEPPGLAALAGEVRRLAVVVDGLVEGKADARKARRTG